jgi:hypothetical protein
LHAAQLVTIDRNQWSRSPEYAWDIGGAPKTPNGLENLQLHQ